MYILFPSPRKKPSHVTNTSFFFKVACRVQVWKKNQCQNFDKFGYNIIKNGISCMYLLCIYKQIIIFRIFKINTLNFTMYISTILTYPLKIYVIRLPNFIPMNIFFTLNIKVFLHNCKEKAENK